MSGRYAPRLEQTVKLCVDFVCDEGEVFWTMLVVQIVSFDDKDFAFVVCNPFFVTFVKIAQVLDADALFVVTATFLNL